MYLRNYRTVNDEPSLGVWSLGGGADNRLAVACFEMKEASSSSPQSVKRDRFRISSTNETGAAPAKKMAYAEGDDVYCTVRKLVS